MTRKFGGKNDEKFWSDKPIQPGHPKFKPTAMSKAEEPNYMKYPICAEYPEDWIEWADSIYQSINQQK